MTPNFPPVSHDLEVECALSYFSFLFSGSERGLGSRTTLPAIKVQAASERDSKEDVSITKLR